MDYKAKTEYNYKGNLHPTLAKKLIDEQQKKNKDAFDKSYFGSDYKELLIDRTKKNYQNGSKKIKY